MTRVVVSGSRCGWAQSTVWAHLDILIGIDPEVTLVVGGAVGVDIYAENWAIARGVPVEVHKADWKKYGRAAGPIRNREMIITCDRVIAFWNGTSTGTAHAVDTAKKLGKPCKLIHKWDPEDVKRLEIVTGTVLP